MLTEVHLTPAGDAHYPAFDLDEWVETRRVSRPELDWVWWERRPLTDDWAASRRTLERWTTVSCLGSPAPRAAGAGLAICAASYVESTLPIGCVGDQCDTHPRRPDSPTADAWYALALALLVVAALGLGLLLLRRGDLGRAARPRSG